MPKRRNVLVSELRARFQIAAVCSLSDGQLVHMHNASALAHLISPNVQKWASKYYQRTRWALTTQARALCTARAPPQPGALMPPAPIPASTTPAGAAGAHFVPRGACRG